MATTTTPKSDALAPTVGGSGGYTLYNNDGSVKSFTPSDTYKANNKADIAAGIDTPTGVGGEINQDAALQKYANTNPEAADKVMDRLGYTGNTANRTTTVNPEQTGADALKTATDSLAATKNGTAISQTPTQIAHGVATNAGGAAPQNAGVGMSVANNAVKTATDNQGYVAPPQVQDAVGKATQQYTDDYAKYMSSSSQGETLVQQYQDLSKQLGIPALDTQLMNMKNVIDGTEDDIRNEVTKAGGFATDSQVLAMSNARNKVMIQNYNNLLETRSNALTQLTTLSGLAAQDRTFAAAQIDKQLNFDQQQITFATNAQKNAQDSIQKSIDNYGAASVLKQALATGDPTAVSRINATMGNGFDLQTAAIAPPSLKDQVMLANIEQSKASTAASYASIAKDNAAAAATTQAKTEAVKGAANTADTVLTAVSKAMKQVNPFSSGTIGGSTTLVPGLPSKNLESTINTIKSNLAFTELAKMRAASPTGGALGAISDKEETLLSSTVASLDVGQSTSQLKENLKNVQTHYVNYLQSLGYGYDAATGTVISP